METIYREMKRADVVVFASPVYLDGITAQMKTVIDRLVCCMQPFLLTDNAGFTRHSFSWRLPENFFVVSTCGFPEPETFRTTMDYFRALARNVSSKIMAAFCVPGSIAIQMKPGALDPKLALLEKAGHDFVKNGAVDEDLAEEINRPLFTREEYFALARLYEDWCRKKLGDASKAGESE